MTRIPPVSSEVDHTTPSKASDAQDIAPSRRDFLHLAGAAAGGAWLAMYLPAIEAAGLYASEVVGTGQAFETLTDDEARVLRAIAARCFPTDETPGAEEAGVIYFMDRALGTFWTYFREPVQGGLAALDAKMATDHPGATDFAALSTAQQDSLLTWLSEDQPDATFVLQILVSCGMFGDPIYGGNRNKVGWQIVGFEDRHVWEPPFGYYDQQYRENGEGGQ